MALALSLAAPTLVAAPRAAAQNAVADAPVELGPSYGDRELIEALAEVALTNDWVASSGLSPDAALVEVAGDAAYVAARREFLLQLGALRDGHGQAVRDAALLDEAEEEIVLLQSMLRGLRREVLATSGSRVLSAGAPRLAHAQHILRQLEIESTRPIFSRDAAGIANYRMSQVQAWVRLEVNHLVRQSRVGSKAAQLTVGRLTALLHELDEVAILVDTARRAGADDRLLAAADRETVVAMMPALHQQRLLAPTSVGGLTTVTVDAYVRGAGSLDASCPVDWALLAGIGRIESRHGTLDNATVLASGNVSADILGPLLDGGATEIEAEAAAIAAEEELVRLAEEAAAATLAAELAEAQLVREFNERVWGEDALDRVAQIAADTAPSDPVGRAAEPPVVEPTPVPRFNPDLWGNAAAEMGGTIEPETNDEHGSPDDEVPEQLGNGFAVILDTDDGRLDGNDRWDRAVGPMQFIPQTWSYWETDGNGDGVMNPQNLYDAAASAGRFLCDLSRRRGASPYAFVLGYNSSSTYVNNVMTAADGYRSQQLPSLHAD